MNDILLKINDLSKTFDPDEPPALERINASLPKGQIVGLAGPDGAGKTTLIRLIAGLLLPTTGSIEVAGYDTVRQADQIHERIGYMPQRFGLYEDLSVIQNLNLYADLRGVVGEERQKRFERLLMFTALAPFTDRFAKDLSGGMKQKLGLACALVRDPALLVLDEPSVGVDPISRRELWKMVHELLGQGISVIWSTAYLDEAEKCDTVLLLNEGKLLFQGVPQKLTEEVKGRVFEIGNVGREKRKLLEEVLAKDEVVDGILQGDRIRVVLKPGAQQLEIGHPVVPVKPRFEDAFIDILGGGPKGGSELAAITPAVSKEDKQVIFADRLTKKFGSFTAASDICFTIQRGEIFGLLGPNGAGKSTTFKMMCGLLTPTEGRALVNGLDLQEAPSEARAQIGYMAQKFSLYGNLTVKQNLEFFSGAYNLYGSAQAYAIKEMVEIFKLHHYLNTPADLLPLGFKQRLALSCASMHHPSVLFLDEPTSGVDPLTRREFWNHINGLVEKGITVMVTTHFMDEAEYCDRIALIYRGKMISSGTPTELKEVAKTEKFPYPTLEDAFIQLIEKFDAEHPL